MSQPTEDPRVVALRRAFDQTFAEPRSEATRALVDFLAIRIHGDPLAIRLEEVSLVLSSPTVVRAPSRAEAFLGLAGLRGEVIPIFSLATLLGYPEGSSEGWLVVARDQEPVGFAFAELEGHQRVEQSAIRTARESESRSEASTEVADGRPVIALHRLLARIRARDTRPDHSKGAMKT